MSEMDELPTSQHESVIQIGVCALRVYVLSDGRRIINAEDLEEFFSGANIADMNEDGIKELAKFIHGEKQ